MRCTLVLAILGLSLRIGLPSEANAQQTNYQVTSSGGTLPSPSVNWFDLGSLPEPDRQQLLSLYEKEFALVQQLNAVRWDALHDTLGGLLDVGFAALGTEANGVVGESAARAGQPGANYNGVNAALAAQTPAEMYESVNRAMDLLTRIAAIDKEIASFRKSHHVDPSLRTPWDKLFPKTKTLTQDEVSRLLTPAAMRMVPDSCSAMKGYAAGCLSSCLHLCNFGGPDAACIAGCQSEYVRELRMERESTAACIASQTSSK